MIMMTMLYLILRTTAKEEQGDLCNFGGRFVQFCEINEKCIKLVKTISQWREVLMIFPMHDDTGLCYIYLIRVSYEESLMT